MCFSIDCKLEKIWFWNDWESPYSMRILFFGMASDRFTYNACYFIIGTSVIIIPLETFAPISSVIRPISSNDLLVDIILALVLENLFNWDTMKG